MLRGLIGRQLGILLNTRAEFFDNLEVLLQAGLSLQNTWTLFKTKASSDWTWIARTVGIPTLVAQRMDMDIRSRFARLFAGQADMPLESIRRINMPVKDGGMGILSLVDSAEAA